MSNKNNSVLKLVGNKLFITLLVFAVSVIMISAVFTRNVRKVTQQQTEEILEDVVEVAETEDAVEEIWSEEETRVSGEDVEDPEKIENVLSYKMPVSGKVQREFSIDDLMWDETMQDWRTHCGMDIEGEAGEAVTTAAPGTVIEVYESEMYGVAVRVLHGDGVITVYKNLEKSVVKKDDVLDEGQMIGIVGNKGSFEMSQKPHLHFEVISEEKYINPAEFIK